MSYSEKIAVSPGEISQNGAPAPLSGFVTKRELAKLLRVSSRTIERWIRLRELPAPVRLGRQIFFHLPTLERHFEQQAVASVQKLNRPPRRSGR